MNQKDGRGRGAECPSLLRKIEHRDSRMTLVFALPYRDTAEWSWMLHNTSWELFCPYVLRCILVSS